MHLSSMTSGRLLGVALVLALLLPFGTSANARTGCSNPNDLFLNPFNADSAHHRPIGNGAQYAGANAPTTRDWLKATTININPGWQQFGNWIDLIPTAGPQYTIRHHGLASGLNLPVTMRLPASVQGTSDNPGGRWDNVITFYDPATQMAHEFFKFNWNNGNPTAGTYRSYSFRGLGHPSQSNRSRVGNSASGAALMFGSLRGHEIETRGFVIGHSLTLALPVRTGNNHMLGKELMAPVFHRDTAVVQNRPGFGEGSIPYGALLALAPSVNINALGLSEPGRRLAEAMRDYGMYVTDMIPNGGQPALQADQHITPATRRQLVQNDIPKIYPHIRMVLNSEWRPGQTAVGGGQPLAPNCAVDASAGQRNVSTPASPPAGSTAQSGQTSSTSGNQNQQPSAGSTSSAGGMLRWDAVRNAQNYYLAMRLSSGSGARVFNRMVRPDAAGCPSGQGMCSFAVPPLPAGQQYGWSVRAVVGGQTQSPTAWQSVASSGDSGSTSAAQSSAPSVPQIGSVTPSTSGGPLRWAAVPRANNYYLAIRAGSGRGERIFGRMVRPDDGGCPSGQGTCSFAVPPLPAGQQYGWSVRAVVGGQTQSPTAWQPVR